VFRSLQSRLTAGFVTIIALTVAAVSVSVSLLYADVLYKQYDATYQNNASVIAALLDSDERTVFFAQSLGAGGAITPIDLPARVTDLGVQFHVRIRIYDTPGHHIVAASKDVAVAPDQHLAPDTFAPLVRKPTVGYVLRNLNLPAPEIEVSHPLTDRAYQQQLFFRDVTIVTLGALLLAFVLSGILAERLTAPFRVLTRAAASLGVGNLSERAPEGHARDGRRDEAGELAHQFNRMARRIEESFALVSAERDRISLDRDNLRQFVADVSHETKAIVDAHRGRITVESAPGHGTTMRLSLPLAPP
jgi:signal transduction histidine kinase